MISGYSNSSSCFLHRTDRFFILVYLYLIELQYVRMLITYSRVWISDFNR